MDAPYKVLQLLLNKTRKCGEKGASEDVDVNELNGKEAKSKAVCHQSRKVVHQSSIFISVHPVVHHLPDEVLALHVQTIRGENS